MIWKDTAADRDKYAFGTKLDDYGEPHGIEVCLYGKFDFELELFKVAKYFLETKKYIDATEL